MTFLRSGMSGAILAATLASISGARVALAQTAANEPASGETTLSEIVVTALRRETKLEDTPIAMSAIGAEDIERQHIVDFGDLQTSIPYFGFTQVTRQETYISMRGT